VIDLASNNTYAFYLPPTTIAKVFDNLCGKILTPQKYTLISAKNV
jgi:hypothetical protein